jgi:hypothetical protein
MTALAFAVVGAAAEPFAAVPTLLLRLRVTESDGTAVQSVALRSQIRIEPQRRPYSPEEEQQLVELFGDTPRWGDTLRPFLWTHATTVVGSFTGTTEVDLPVACSYDLEVAGAKYLHSLRDGEVPLVLLFSGTVFTTGGSGVVAEPVPWDAEASYRLPVAVWRDVMDHYFPGSGWLRLQRDTLDRLQRFKADRVLPTWDAAVEQLLKEAGEDS